MKLMLRVSKSTYNDLLQINNDLSYFKLYDLPYWYSPQADSYIFSSESGGRTTNVKTAFRNKELSE